MVERLNDDELEGLMRSAAIEPLSSEAARRDLETYKAIADDQKELAELLERLGPAWSEVRAALNELANPLEG